MWALKVQGLSVKKRQTPQGLCAVWRVRTRSGCSFRDGSGRRKRDLPGEIVGMAQSFLEAVETVMSR